MNSKSCLISLLLFASILHVHCQDRIRVNIPSATAETEYIWWTLQETRFFEEYGYTVSLPDGALIDQLKEKSKGSTLTDEDYEQLERYVRDSIYNEEDYQLGYKKILKEVQLLNRMINCLDTTNYPWDFRIFNPYTVNLTLYGPGGSYNPDEGSILVYTTPSGQFKGYENPANIIIHEAVHIGIETSIILKYNVPHALKERIVDTFVSLHFGQYLPQYNIQNMGDTRSDEHLKTISDLTRLDRIVEELINGE